MDVIRGGKVSKNQIYGSSERRGKTISELERKKLVETRFFEGERGRGGKIIKVRVAYENENVKRLLDEREK